MSCLDPNCPDCGNSPQAKMDRENRQSIFDNPELMYGLRVLAANAIISIVDGTPAEKMSEFICSEIIRGKKDDDHVVQGLIMGMTVLMRDHPQFQQLSRETREVPRGEGYQRRWKAVHGYDFPDNQTEFPGSGITDLGGGFMAMEINVNDLPQFLRDLLDKDDKEGSVH